MLDSRPTWVTLATLVIVLALPVSTPARGSRLERAAELFEAGDYQAAFDLADSILSAHDHPTAHLLLAAAATRLGKFSVAEAHLEIVLELASDMPGLDYEFGILQQTRADDAAARGKRKKAVKLYLKADPHFRRELRSDPDHLGALEGRAVCLVNAGEREQAIEAFETWIDVDPESDEARARLARLLSDEGRIEEAQATLESAPAAETEEGTLATLTMARTLFEDGRIEEARELMNELRERPSNSLRARGLEALDHLASGEPLEAADALRSFVASSPPADELADVGDAYLALYRSLRQEWTPDRAVEAGVTLPEIELQVHVTYPSDAKRLNVSGRVTLVALVQPNGTIADIDVLSVSSSHNPEFHEADFREAATEAVRQWIYRPATRDGEPIAYSLPLAVNFTPKRVRKNKKPS